ncbi:hypothetical protein LSH36_356g03069 [Paralvinella palmiformis]|uniref:G-protein coupled receptors family 1 profile domain-containing protein n=1 Tax=Paralvinella palmiformis TaxID=53620 RepID=A0AAD9JF95_9ANNE|nr:hypothetical protein LSH36_356g03069 [Paralvinella palmiformis]
MANGSEGVHHSVYVIEHVIEAADARANGRPAAALNGRAFPPAYREVSDNRAPFWLACNETDLISFAINSSQPWQNCSLIDQSQPDYRHPGLGALLSCFALITILGNLLVIIAVARERYLRTVTNYFIVSLAVADLIIGSVVMPFSISMEVTDQLWYFGGDWCDVWHSFDVLASTASILNLSVISLDRYWAITDPIAYPGRMSVGRALILIALVWICSAAISFPAILWWRAVIVHPQSPQTCFFTEDAGYLIFSSIVSFYFPVSIILFAYYRIYRAASIQTRSLKAGSKVMVSDGVNGEAMTLRMHRGGARMHERHVGTRYARANSDSDPECSPAHGYAHATLAYGEARPSRMISRKWKHFAISRKLSKVAKERKAAKTLGIVMGVFCICWVPFFVSNVLYGVCNTRCVTHADILFPVFTWLGYINSGMNPAIYAYSMRDFRRAFIRILCCCCPGYYRFRARRTLYEHGSSSSGFPASCHSRQ